jgi:flavoprotein hydroxylase
MNMVWQPALEQGLEGSASDQPSVELRRGVRVTGLVEHADHVTLDVQTTAGERSTLDARYVVGCDGANSTVRDLIASDVTDLGFFYDWLIVDLQLHQPRTFDPVNLQICDPVRPTTAVSGGPGRRRWEFMRLPHETVEQLDDEATAWALLEPWEVTPETATLERHAVYRFHARWADRWRVGRTLLAGDAAHQMPPFAGQGMCSGLRDAANLTWKLDLVLRGLSPDALLDAYEVEREANVRAVIRFSMDLGKVICVSDPDEAAERDALMLAGSHGSATPVPPLPGIDRGVVLAGDPLAGMLFTQGRVTGADGAPRLLDDVVGAGWHLVVATAEARAAVPADGESWLAERGGRVVAPDELGDVDGTYADWFAAHGVVAVLQRPDLHVFGTATTPADVAPLLDAVRQALTDPATHLVPSTGGAP